MIAKTYWQKYTYQVYNCIQISFFREREQLAMENEEFLHRHKV